MSEDAPTPTVWPAFHYEDAPRAIRFLVEAFGFEPRAIYVSDDDPNFIDHAELRWPEGGGVMLGSAKKEGVMQSVPVGAGAAYVVTDHPDELYERAKRAGATILMEPTDQDYGSRDFAAADPEGVRWSFGTYRGHAGPAAVPDDF